MEADTIFLKVPFDGHTIKIIPRNVFNYILFLKVNRPVVINSNKTVGHKGKIS